MTRRGALLDDALMAEGVVDFDGLQSKPVQLLNDARQTRLFIERRNDHNRLCRCRGEGVCNQSGAGFRSGLYLGWG